MSKDRQRRAIAVVFEGVSAVRDPTLLAKIEASLTLQGLPGAKSTAVMLERDQNAKSEKEQAFVQTGERECDSAGNPEGESEDEAQDDGLLAAGLMGKDMGDDDRHADADFDASEEEDDDDITDASDEDSAGDAGPSAAKKARVG